MLDEESYAFLNTLLFIKNHSLVSPFKIGESSALAGCNVSLLSTTTIQIIQKSFTSPVPWIWEEDAHYLTDNL